jgi:pyrimidine-nucleoside phosphorylase
MSKKLAVGTDLILLDVKAGSGAFMKTAEAAAGLASACVELAGYWGRAARAAVTDMSQPLGSAIGNAIDVAECVRLLKGEEKGRLRDLSIAFAAEALVALQDIHRDEARSEVTRVLDSGDAAESFGRMVEAQGGDRRVVDDPWSVLPRAAVRREVGSEAGYLKEVDAEVLGRTAVALGAGRMRKGDPIDPTVGIEFFPKLGDRLETGQPIAVIHARDESAATGAEARIRRALTISQDPVEAPPLVYGWYGADVGAGGHRSGKGPQGEHR